MMERYAKHPAIIGYQVDNELETRGINNRDYFIGFRNYIKTNSAATSTCSQKNGA